MLDLDDIADAWSRLPPPPSTLLIDLDLSEQTITLKAVAVNRWLWMPIAAFSMVFIAALGLVAAYTGVLNLPSPMPALIAAAAFFVLVFVVATGAAAFMAKTTIVAGRNTLAIYNAFGTAAEGQQEPYALDEIDTFELNVSPTETMLTVYLGNPDTSKWFRRQPKSSLRLLRRGKSAVKLFVSFGTEARQWLILPLEAVMALHEQRQIDDEVLLLAEDDDEV